jgi:hypothetical protein
MALRGTTDAERRIIGEAVLIGDNGNRTTASMGSEGEDNPPLALHSSHGPLGHLEHREGVGTCLSTASVNTATVMGQGQARESGGEHG